MLKASGVASSGDSGRRLIGIGIAGLLIPNRKVVRMHLLLSANVGWGLESTSQFLLPLYIFSYFLFFLSYDEI